MIEINKLLKAKQNHYYNKHARFLKEMAAGDTVMMQANNKWKPAKVITVSHDAPQSYIIKTPDGQTYRRNRRQLKKGPNQKSNVTLNDDYLSEDSYDEHEDNTTEMPSNDTNREGLLPLQATPPMAPLRRSKRTIRKPERYCNSNY